MRRLWLLLPISVILPAVWLLGSDVTLFLKWWLAVLLIGLIWWPLAAKLLPAGDHGWIMSKGIGLAFSSLAAFVFQYTTPLPFSQLWFICLLVITAILVWTSELWLSLLRSQLSKSKAVTSHHPQNDKILSVRGVLSATTSTPRRADKYSSWGFIVAAETIFGFAFLFFLFGRGLKPDLDSLEKFMNIGFMNSIWRSDSLPAVDMWFSGSSINYYYFGHYVFTWLAKIVNIKPVIAYQLAMATLPSLSLLLAGGFGLHLSLTLSQHRQNQDSSVSRLLATAAAIISGGLVVLGGNQHAFLFTDNSPAKGLISFLIRHNWLPGSNESAFWFANSTRYIGYNPATQDKTIHEFPYYSYLVADLHAHVINLVFVLTFLLIIVSFVHRRTKLNENVRSRLKEPYFYLFAIFLAIFMMGNFWDFIIYFALLCLLLWISYSRQKRNFVSLPGLFVFLLQAFLLLLIFIKISQPLLAVSLLLMVAIFNMVVGRFADDGLSSAGSVMGWIFFLAHLIALPFNMGFEPIAKDIALTVNRTPVSQLLVLWGAHLSAGLILTICLIYLRRRPRLRKVFPPQPQQLTLATEPDRSLFTRMKQSMAAALSEPADRLLTAVFLMGVLLIILPELIYVVDIYSGDFKRANTMFKFTYQAYVLLSLVWGSAISSIIAHRLNVDSANYHFRGREEKTKSSGRNIAANTAVMIPVIILTAMLIIPAWYPLNATTQWIGSISKERYQGLDALSLFALKDSAHIEENRPGELAADVAAIKWLNENISGQPVVLEAYGDSYTDYNRISAFTGLPTVIGWQTHEWLWRTSAENPDAYSAVVIPRQQAVRDIYTTDDQELRLALIREYEIKYIIVGQLEREKFGTVSEDDRKISLIREDLINQIGEKVFSQSYFSIYRINQN